MRKKYLLDTNICVFWLRGKYDVDKKIDAVGMENCFISEITSLELMIGAELLRQRDGKDMSASLKHFLDSINILPISSAINIAAKEKVRLRLAGTPVEDDFDLLIACTSIANNYGD